MSEHDGHRSRMRQRFFDHGLENFDDHNVLEFILFYALPRQDTNVLAHRLMDTFGSLDRVFEATPQELLQVKGVGENVAALIHLVPEAGRRYLIAKNSYGGVLRNSQEAGAYLLPRFLNCRTEQVWLLCMDSALHVLDCRCISEGDVTSVALEPRRVIQQVLLCSAANVIIAHNHLCGIAIPSEDDKVCTRKLADALELVGVKLCDHIIVGGDDFVSLSDSGFFSV